MEGNASAFITSFEHMNPEDISAFRRVRSFSLLLYRFSRVVSRLSGQRGNETRCSSRPFGPRPLIGA